MSYPTREQMVTISSRMAARALTRAADPETRDQLVAAMRSWLPDADQTVLRGLAPGVAADFRILANAIEARLARLQERGKAQPLPSETTDGRR